MPIDITPVFVNYLAKNRNPVSGDSQSRQRADFGLSASLEGSTIDLVLAFRAGSSYCCMEWGCHTNLFEDKHWCQLREEFHKLGIEPPARFSLQALVIVEAGALFFDPLRPNPARRGDYALAPAEAQQYRISIAEMDAPSEQ